MFGPFRGPKGTIGCDVDAQLMAERDVVPSAKLRVQLDLVHGRLDLGETPQLLNKLRPEVAHADRLGLVLLHGLLKGPPGLVDGYLGPLLLAIDHINRIGPMDKHQVDLGHLQFL